MTYNMTQLQGVQTIYQLVVYANDSTTGTIAVLFLLSIFFVLLMALKRYSFGSALISSSAVSLVISLLLVYAKLLAPIWALVFLILTAFSAFVSSIFD